MKNKILTFKKVLEETKFMDTIDFNKPFKIMVDCPTGGGKTHYIMKYLIDKKLPFVFLTDTLLLMEQVAKDWNMPTYSAANKSAYNAKSIVTVYNHLGVFFRDKIIIIDEAHSMVEQYDWKSEVIKDMITFCELSSNRILMLSGTPLYSKDEFYNNINVIKCVRETPVEYNIKNVEVDDFDTAMGQAITLCKNMKVVGKLPVISLLNTGDDLAKVVTTLTECGFKNIATINSIVKNNSRNSNGEVDIQSTHYKELIEKATINADVLVTTYVQGYNIKNENCGLIFLPSKNKHTYVSLVQMVARFRNIKDLDCYLFTIKESIKYKRNEKGEFLKDEDGKKIELEPKARTVWNDYNKMWDYLDNNITQNAINEISTKKKEYKTNRAAYKMLGMESEFKHLITEYLEVDNQMVACDVVKSISNQMYYLIPTANNILKQYNLKITQMETKIEKTIPTNAKASKADYNEAIAQYWVMSETGKYLENTSTYIHEVRKTVDLLAENGMSLSAIKKVLLGLMGDKKAINKLVDRLSFTNNTNQNVKNIRLGIIKRFKKGEWVNNDVIFNTIKELTENNCGNCKSKTEATNTLSTVFEIQLSVRRVDGINTRGYIIGEIL